MQNYSLTCFICIILEKKLISSSLKVIMYSTWWLWSYSRWFSNRYRITSKHMIQDGLRTLFLICPKIIPSQFCTYWAGLSTSEQAWSRTGQQSSVNSEKREAVGGSTALRILTYSLLPSQKITLNSKLAMGNGQSNFRTR